jgi:peptidoglycan/LPS O-acetylase OafA/YrhL
MSPMKRHSTVQDVIDSHSGVAPGFGFLRHALAVVIILYHTYNITFGRDANPGYAKGELIANWSDLGATQFAIEVLRPGLFALVGAFFALSGFLVAGSALRTKSVRVFLSFRVLRILPALLTEVTLSALVLGPIVTVHSLSQYFSGSEFYHYFGNILGIVRYTLPGVFVDNPRANFVNANLWTLPAEFYCYLVLAALMGVGVFFQRRLYNWAFLLGTVALLALPPLFGLSPRADNTHYSVYYIVYLFFVGALFYLYAHSIPVRCGMFAISGLGYYVLTLVGGFDLLAGFLLVYCVVYLGGCEFPTWSWCRKCPVTPSRLSPWAVAWAGRSAAQRMPSASSRTGESAWAMKRRIMGTSAQLRQSVSAEALRACPPHGHRRNRPARAAAPT